MSGTSMATPHVAGAVALLWSARPGLKNNIELTEEILNNSAVPISTTDCSSSGIPNNVYGYGRLDIHAAVTFTGPLMTRSLVEQSAYAGSSAVYSLRVFNADQISHSIVISPTTQWPISLAPASIIGLNSYAHADITVTIHVPFPLGDSQIDTATIVARYQDDASKAVTSTLTTIGLSHQYWLPILLDNFPPFELYLPLVLKD
jgi:Subtilase family